MTGMETRLISQRKFFTLRVGLEIKSQCSSAVEQRFRKPSVAGSIPAIGSILNCGCSNSLGEMASATDTKTDTNFGVRNETSVTGDEVPVTR